MKNSIAHLVVACLLSVAAIGGYAAARIFINAKSATIADLDQKIATKTSMANHIAAARVSAAEIAGDEETIRGYFVSNDEVVSFINGLESLGKKIGTTVTVLSVTPGATNDRPSFVFALSVKGSFDAVMRTVGAIEYAPYDLSVSTLAVGKDDKLWHADLGFRIGSATKTTP